MTGYRIRGYLCPQTSGTYQFYYSITAAVGQFSLSTDRTASNLNLLGFGDSVSLIGGEKYYFEALAKNNNDYRAGTLQAQWQGPGIDREIIPGSFMIPVDFARPEFPADTITLRDVLVGESYSENMRSKIKTLDMWDVVEYEAAAKPAWLNISTDGMLTGTPNANDVGLNEFVLRMTAPGGLFDETKITIDVQANQPSQFLAHSIYLGSVDENSDVNISLSTYANDANIGPRLSFGDRLSFSIVSGPEWLHIELTGEIYGIPGNGHVGLNTFVVRATDIGGLFVDEEFRINVANVQQAPVLDDFSVQNYAGRWVSGQLTDHAYDLDGDELTFTKTSGDDWLNIQNDGSYSGLIPTNAPETNEFTIRVADIYGNTDTGIVKVTALPDFRIAYEGFEGLATGSIDGTDGGTGWAGPWSGDADWRFAANGLTFPGLQDSVGLKCTMGKQGSTVERFFSNRITVDPADDELDQLWVAAMMDLKETGGIRSDFSSQVRLLNGIDIGYFGKGVNKSIGFDLGGWNQITGNLGISNGTAGVWLMVIHLKCNANGNTDIKMYAARENETFDINAPATFPHVASSTFGGAVAIDGLSLYRWNITEAFIDEICVSQWYETIVEKIEANNNRIDFSDFAVFGRNWLDESCGFCDGFDYNSNGIVDIADLQIFATNWLSDL